MTWLHLQASSALTLKVLGNVKNAVVVYLGIVMLGEKVTSVQVGPCVCAKLLSRLRC